MDSWIVGQISFWVTVHEVRLRIAVVLGLILFATTCLFVLTTLRRVVNENQTRQANKHCSDRISLLQTYFLLPSTFASCCDDSHHFENVVVCSHSSSYVCIGQASCHCRQTHWILVDFGHSRPWCGRTYVVDARIAKFGATKRTNRKRDWYSCGSAALGPRVSANSSRADCSMGVWRGRIIDLYHRLQWNNTAKAFFEKIVSMIIAVVSI